MTYRTTEISPLTVFRASQHLSEKRRRKQDGQAQQSRCGGPDREKRKKTAWLRGGKREKTWEA
ncbi:MAG: hypothetical protein PsegKO_10710 [Pseudohongiellaceae bacterium]